MLNLLESVTTNPSQEVKSALIANLVSANITIRANVMSTGIDFGTRLPFFFARVMKLFNVFAASESEFNN